MSRLVYLDLDGVLVDFLGGVSRLLGLPIDPALEKWGLGAAFGISNTRAWKRIDEAGMDFWIGLDPLPWCEEVYEAVAEQSELAFLSSSGGYPNADAGKRQWLRDRWGRDVADRLTLVGSKKHKPRLAAGGAMLIDDHEDTVEAWRKAGGIGVLFPAPWNYLRGEDPLLTVAAALDVHGFERVEKGRAS